MNDTITITITPAELCDTEMHIHQIAVFNHEYRPHCDNYGTTWATGRVFLASEDGQIMISFWFNAQSEPSHSKYTPSDEITYVVDRDLPEYELDVLYNGPEIIGVIHEHETVEAWLNDFVSTGGLAAYWEHQVSEVLKARDPEFPVTGDLPNTPF